MTQRKTTHSIFNNFFNHPHLKQKFHFRNSGGEHLDVETIGHTTPLFYNSAKINEQLDNDDMPEFEDNWMDKVD